VNTKNASRNNKAFYPGKRVFLTGHTGFKGAWMTAMLHELGAVVMGYALAPEKESLYKKIGGDSLIQSVIADVRDFRRLRKELVEFEPEIVIHFAALLPVQSCYDDPRLAYETHVTGRLICLRRYGPAKRLKVF
jgi:CDP-glucose 4,6-dehydratase